MDGTCFEFAADEHLDSDASGVEAHRILHVHGDLFVGQFFTEDAWPAAGTQYHRLGGLGRNYGPQDAARTEQGVAGGQQRHDAEIDTFEPGRRALEVSVVDRQHHGPASGRSEDARKAILHAPVELVRTFQVKPRRGLRLLDLVFSPFFVGFRHASPCSCWADALTKVGGVGQSERVQAR